MFCHCLESEICRKLCTYITAVPLFNHTYGTVLLYAPYRPPARSYNFTIPANQPPGVTALLVAHVTTVNVSFVQQRLRTRTGGQLAELILQGVVTLNDRQYIDCYKYPQHQRRSPDSSFKAGWQRMSGSTLNSLPGTSVHHEAARHYAVVKISCPFLARKAMFA